MHLFNAHETIAKRLIFLVGNPRLRPTTCLMLSTQELLRNKRVKQSSIGSEGEADVKHVSKLGIRISVFYSVSRGFPQAFSGFGYVNQYEVF